jgi:hypothetical protein
MFAAMRFSLQIFQMTVDTSGSSMAVNTIVMDGSSKSVGSNRLSKYSTCF